jgi:outer membrane protein
VLRSQANLSSLDAQEAAARQVLDQKKEQFDVGVATITDVYDAQANADLVSVSKLREQNTLNQRKEALEAITGQPVGDLSQLNANFPIVPMQPANMQSWVELAQQQNLAIRIASLSRDAKEQDLKAAKARSYPTVSLNTNFNWSKDGTSSYTVIPPQAFETAGVAIRVSVPLFTGGQLSAANHQASYNLEASTEGLTKSQRDNTQGARNAYRNVDTDIKAVAANAQSLVSAQSAAESTQVGAEVGTRNVVEVVQAQQRLFQAQRDLANSRFDYVLDTLTLKQSAGVLSPQDVSDLNQWLHQ